MKGVEGRENSVPKIHAFTKLWHVEDLQLCGMVSEYIKQGRYRQNQIQKESRQAAAQTVTIIGAKALKC